MGDVVPLWQPNPGNGAREALIGVAQSLPNNTGLNDAIAWTDWLLLELWMRGFKVVPLEPEDEEWASPAA